MGRVRRMSMALVACAAILGAPFAVAAGDGDESSRLELLESRLLALEDELSATKGALEQSEKMRATAMPDVSQGTALDNFLSGLEVGGHVAASYTYNWNNPDSNTGLDPTFGTTGGPSPQAFNQFNLNHNTFELDAFKLEIGKPADAPGTAGFQVDLLFGANNHILCNDIFDASGSDVDTTDDGEVFLNRSDRNVCVQEMNVKYNYEGTLLTFGKFETLLGAEVLDTNDNNHVQHGMIFTFGIPLVHTGLLAQGDINENMGWAVGVVNGWDNSTDLGDNKAVLGQLSYTDGPLNTALSAFVGSEQLRASTSKGIPVGDNNNRVQVYDWVTTYEASPELSFWGEAVYGYLEWEPDVILSPISGFTAPAVDEDPEWYGVGGGFKYMINPKTSLAMRGEWMMDDGGSRFGGGANDSTYVTGTATLAYALTNNLMARLEYRHDVIDTDPADTSPFPQADRGFCGGANVCEDQSDSTILEVVYSFD